MDPFYGTDEAGEALQCRSASEDPFGRHGCDAPTSLVKWSIDHAKNFTSTDLPSFILLTGDLVRHGTDQLVEPIGATLAILESVSELVYQAFPNTSIIPTVGNNDVTPDYFLDVDAPDDMLGLLSQGFDSLFQSDQEKSTFRAGGFFARRVSPTLTVISLNTLIYSSSHFPATGQADPLGQLVWLKSQLNDAQVNNIQVYIAGHIPPAVGSYRHSQLWNDQYLDQYYTLIREFQSTILAHCFGHLHADEFRFIQREESHLTLGWPLLLASSVTPVYGSQPSVRQVTYDTNGNAILDYDTWFLELGDEIPSWHREDSFIESFPMATDASSKSIANILKELEATISKKDSLIWSTLTKRQHISTNETLCSTFVCRNEWLCTLKSSTYAEYAECMETEASITPTEESWWERHSQWDRWVVVAMTISAFLVTFLALFLIGSWNSRRQHYHIYPSEDDDVETVATTGRQVPPRAGANNNHEVLEEKIPIELPRIS